MVDQRISGKLKERIDDFTGALRAEFVGHRRERSQVGEHYCEFDDVPLFDMHVAAAANVRITAAAFDPCQTGNRAKWPGQGNITNRAARIECSIHLALPYLYLIGTAEARRAHNNF